MAYPISETVTLVATPEVAIPGCVVAFGQPSKPQLGDVVEQPLQILDPAHTSVAAGDVLRVRGQLAEVTGVQDHTHPITGWRPPSIIHATQVALILPDTCTISDPQGSGWSWDGTTEVYNAGTALWSGACNVLPSGRAEQVEQSGGQQVTSGQWTVLVPWDTPRLTAGLVLTVTAARDGVLVGHRLTVTGVGGGSLTRGRRLSCVDSQEA